MSFYELLGFQYGFPLNLPEPSKKRVAHVRETAKKQIKLETNTIMPT